MKRIFIQTCQFIIILNLGHTYVLFAANLDDFRSIAKKFIPGKLADQLTDMAAQNSNKYRQHKQLDEIVKDITEENDEKTVTVPRQSQIDTIKKKRFLVKGQTQQLDFDQLVNKVRQQLEQEFKNKLQEEKRNQAHKVKKEMNNQDAENIEELYEELTEKSPKLKLTTKAKTTKDTQTYYEYDESPPPEDSATPKDDGLFEGADLANIKDSYEDYVTPKKDNIFESDTETKTTKSIRIPSERESKYQGQRLKAVNPDNDNKKTVFLINDQANEEHAPLAENDDGTVLWVENDEPLPSIQKKKPRIVPLAAKNEQSSAEYEQEYKEHKSGEVKAQTGKLLDNEPDYATKKMKGTMIPTRYYYKMSSPNYYKQIPAVAEKYDFNEPLPEIDREPENLKYFSNPPALINKKVKIKK